MPGLPPASQVGACLLTDAPQPMEPAGRARKVTVEGRVGGSQEIKKHKEILGREARTGEARRDAASLVSPASHLTGTQWGLVLQ